MLTVNTTERASPFPRNRAFRHYIIYSFTQNVIVANMALTSEIRGRYSVHPCVMRFSRFRSGDAAVRGRVFASASWLRSPEAADTFLLNESLSEGTNLPRDCLEPCNSVLALSLLLFRSEPFGSARNSMQLISLIPITRGLLKSPRVSLMFAGATTPSHRRLPPDYSPPSLLQVIM